MRERLLGGLLAALLLAGPAPAEEPARFPELAPGRAVVAVVIKATWCRVCLDELNRLRGRLERIRELGAEVVAVTHEDGPVVESYRGALGADIRVLSDPGGEGLIGPLGFLRPGWPHPVPGVAFLDRCGRPAYVLRGRRPGWSQTEAILETLARLRDDPAACDAA